MTQFSDYLESGLLNLTLRGQAFTPPSGTYLALNTADPTDTGGSEIVAAWYGRQTIGLSTGWTAPADDAGGKACMNVNQLTFNAVTGAQVVVTHISIYDALTNGNLYYYAPLTASKTLQVGDVLAFAASSIKVTLK